MGLPSDCWRRIMNSWFIAFWFWPIFRGLFILGEAILTGLACSLLQSLNMNQWYSILNDTSEILTLAMSKMLTYSKLNLTWWFWRSLEESLTLGSIMLNVKRLVLYQLLLMCSMLQRTNRNILKRLAHHIGILALFSNQISIATISLDSIDHWDLPPIYGYRFDRL